jgi:hypothetical protein
LQREYEQVFSISSASEAQAWRTKHPLCCIPSVINAAPGRTGTTAMST